MSPSQFQRGGVEDRLVPRQLIAELPDRPSQADQGFGQGHCRLAGLFAARFEQAQRMVEVGISLAGKLQRQLGTAECLVDLRGDVGLAGESYGHLG